MEIGVLDCTINQLSVRRYFDECLGSNNIGPHWLSLWTKKVIQEVFTEMEKYGEVEEMSVCDNFGDHLVGNVYVKFWREKDAEKAVLDLNNRLMTNQYMQSSHRLQTSEKPAECSRGGFCNFMHLKPISRELRRELYGRCRKRHRFRSRSREIGSRDRRGGRERERKKSRDHE